MAFNTFLKLVLINPFVFGFGSSDKIEPNIRIGVTFNYEGQTMQKIRTGCRGTLFPESKETHQIFYIVDATGTMKYVEPGSTVQVIFPFTTDGIDTHPHKRQMVRFTEICFPAQCNAATCGRTVGPLYYGLDTNIAATAPGQPANWLSGIHAQELAQALAPGLYSGILPEKPCSNAAPTPELNVQLQGSGSSVQGFQAAQALNSKSKPLCQPEKVIPPPLKPYTKPVIFQAASTASANPGTAEGNPLVLESAASAGTTTSNDAPTAALPLSISTTTFAETSSSFTSGDASINDAKPEPPASSIPASSTFIASASISASAAASLISSSPDVSNAEASSEGKPKPLSIPLNSALEATEILDVEATVLNNKPEIPLAPPLTASTVTSITSQPNSNGVHCPASCTCCSNPTQFSTSSIASSTLGSPPTVSSWPSWFPLPWQMNTAKNQFEESSISKENDKNVVAKRDADYYANLPGAIRGSTHVIYYPSCERDAYYQPAIVNFCSYPNSAFSYGKVSQTISKF